jgi:hypothetical protein
VAHRSSRPLLASGALLVGAGVALAGAAAVRWAPCFEGVDVACVRAQDHAADYDLVSAPFVPITGAVLLAAAGTLLLVALWVLQATRSTGVARVAALAAATVLAFSAGGQLLAALSDGTLGVLPAVVAPVLVVQLLLSLLPLVAAVLLARRAEGGERIAWIVLTIVVVAGFPVVEYTLLIALSGSHDSPVGFGWVRAATLAIAGVALLTAGVRRPVPARPAVAAVTAR